MAIAYKWNSIGASLIELNLSLEEVQALLVILEHVSGDPETSPRLLADGIYQALRKFRDPSSRVWNVSPDDGSGIHFRNYRH